MKLFDLQQEREKQELEQMAEDLTRLHMTAGHQSEPTTPPEYRDHVFPSLLSRPNRFSTSSLTSPLGLSNRTFRSGSQLTSPPSDLVQSPQHQATTSKLPSKSVPGSRRGSNDKDKVYVPESTITNPRANALYVYSPKCVLAFALLLYGRPVLGLGPRCAFSASSFELYTRLTLVFSNCFSYHNES